MSGKILLFHVNIFKQNSIVTLCRDLKIKPVIITAEYQGNTLEELAQGTGVPKKSTIPVSEEMLLFCALNPEQLDQFLTQYHARGIPIIPLKAVLTPSNRLWTPARLCNELQKERKALQK